jgi:hypothetical protein
MFELQRNRRDVAFELLPLSPDFKFAIVLMIISEPSTQSNLSSGNLQIDALVISIVVIITIKAARAIGLG